MLERLRNAAFARLAPNRVYVRKVYREKTGKELDLEHPRTFNEKIQWLKLYYHNPILTRMADKYEAKEVVRERLGSDRSVPTAAIFDDPGEIRLDDLPESLALKATHGSGWNIISRDKSVLDENEVRSYFRFWLGKSYYMYSKEWAYKHIRPRVICEPLLVDENGSLPLDYKIYCFAGSPRFIRLIDRYSNNRRAFYDLDWNKLPFSIDYSITSDDFEKPRNLQEMLNIAETLSKGLPLLRVDLYLVRDRVFVGELTAYPANGMGRFTDETWNRKLGDLLELPSTSECAGPLPQQPTS